MVIACWGVKYITSHIQMFQFTLVLSVWSLQYSWSFSMERKESGIVGVNHDFEIAITCAFDCASRILNLSSFRTRLWVFKWQILPSWHELFGFFLGWNVLLCALAVSNMRSGVDISEGKVGSKEGVIVRDGFLEWWRKSWVESKKHELWLRYSSKKSGVVVFSPHKYSRVKRKIFESGPGLSSTFSIKKRINVKSLDVQNVFRLILISHLVRDVLPTVERLLFEWRKIMADEKLID